MAPQTHLAPYLDSVLTYGHGYAIPQVHKAPFLDTLATWGHTPLVGEQEAGRVVKVGSTVLDGAMSVEFRDELRGVGTWRMRMANDDPDMPAFDEIVAVQFGGVTRFAGRVEGKRPVTFAPSEKIAEETVVFGSGRLAVTDKASIEPSRGLASVPVERTRSLSWVSFDFPDDDWQNSKRIRRSDTPTALPPNRFSPEWWPAPSWWVWANRPDVSETSAPGGRCLFRQHFTLAADATIAILVAGDNTVSAWLDGGLLFDSENDPSSYTIGSRVTRQADAGEHVLAANVLNTGKGGGLNWQVWTVDDEGLLDELVASSDSDDTLCLPYPFPDNPPTVTATWAVRQIVEEHQAKNAEYGGTVDWVLDFDDDYDSAGNPSTRVAEITVDTDQTLRTMLESLSDWLIDVQMAPGANVIRVWNWGTRGGVPGVTVAGNVDRETAEIEGLSHDGRYVRANRLQILYRRGHTEVVDQDSIDELGEVRSEPLVLGNIDSEDTAKGVGRRLLENRKAALYGHTLTLAPVSSLPYIDFGVGDYITHPDENGDPVLSRVLAISYTEDEDGNPTWVLELNVVRQIVQERHENWLRFREAGAFSGGARLVSKTGESLESAQRISTNQVVEFSHQDPTDGVITGKSPADSSGNLIEIVVEVSTEDDVATSSATQVRVWEYVPGSPAASLGTVTVPAGETQAELNLDASKTYRNIYKYRSEVITVGGNVNGISVKLRAI